ncbi:uncharacterized protein K02A2.6-like [Papaver somniferum]|uniref:uncharacterized protein K02A2.6-like n=1 Tax=Papaver somniferum TaxID=3469 RepID=UPI000E6F94A3|nr:uncharacterized protein K02A2.6-like [Papaver somniferum]
MCIVSDNGTPFVNNKVKDLLASFHIKRKTSTPYYPKGNGQAEATNKILLQILRRNLYNNKRLWNEELPMALWAYRTAKRSSTGASPYSLVYGEDVVLSAEIVIASTRVIAASGLQVEDSKRFQVLDTLEEKRDIAYAHADKYRE